MMRRLLLLIAGAGIVACSTEQPPLFASDVVVRKTTPQMGVVYLSLSNTSEQAIRITRVISPDFEQVQMHVSELHGDISRMRPLDVIEIAPGETEILAPGGKHLMISKPSTSRSVVTLQFYSEDSLLLSVETTAEGWD